MISHFHLFHLSDYLNDVEKLLAPSKEISRADILERHLCRAGLVSNQWGLEL